MQTITRQVGNPPKIQAVSPNLDRPYWSVMIPTFNCAKYLAKTLSSVLAQDPGPEHMQIEVVDDCSTQDNPEQVVNELGQGRVKFYRQPQNGGATANFNTCIDRSTGKFVHILHGDDFVAPGFYRQFESMIDQHPNAALFACRAFHIDEAGEIDILSPRLTALETCTSNASAFFYDNQFRTPAMVIKRSFYEAHGGFDSSFKHVADWEMWLRAVSLESGVAINEPLAYYRLFPNNDTGRLAKTGDNLRDCLSFAQLMATQHEDFHADRFIAEIKQRALHQAFTFMAIRDKEASRNNAKLWWQMLSSREKFQHLTYSILNRNLNGLRVFKQAI